MPVREVYFDNFISKNGLEFKGQNKRVCRALSNRDSFWTWPPVSDFFITTDDQGWLFKPKILVGVNLGEP
jgi:hypothetical protein